MERIKAVYAPGTNKEEEATIIKFLPAQNEIDAETEVIWINNDGIICQSSINHFRVDMDSFTGRKTQRELLDIGETLLKLWRKISTERKVD